MKKILIPNGSFHDIPLIREAKKLGYYVITSGAAPDAPGHPYADEYVYGDFSETDTILAIAKDKKVDAICSNCNDFGYLSSCYVAECLGLSGYESYENALTLHQKDLFKKFAKQYQIATPIAEGFENQEIAKEWAKKAEYPLIVKPVDLGAGQGIHKAEDWQTVFFAIEDAFQKSRCKKIVIEPFIEGSSHSFNAFIVKKRVASFYSDNEYMKYSAYRVSTSAGPADDINKVKEILITQTELVAEKLQLTDGLVHLQYILDQNAKPHILEITRRMSGDWYPYPEMYATGIDWVNYIVRAQCGMDCSDFPVHKRQQGFTGRHCLNAPHEGRVTGVRFHPKLQKAIFDKVMWLKESFEIKDVEKDYPGIIFYCFDTREEMMEIVEQIDNYIEFKYD